MKTPWGENKIILVENDFIFDTDRERAVRELKKFLSRCCRMKDYFALYHGTDRQHKIYEQGLLPTCNSRKKSMQSGNSYVYLSIYPDMALTFGKMANPMRDIVVYEVNIPLRMMIPDKDQLNNKRLWGNDKNIGNDLASSLIHGSGCKVKGKIEPNLITGEVEP